MKVGSGVSDQVQSGFDEMTGGELTGPAFGARERGTGARNASPESGSGRSVGTAEDTRHHLGSPGLRRANLALFAAGVATFVLLYSTQALLPALSADLRLTPGQASLTVSAATLGLALAVLPMSALSERFGRTRLMTASLIGAVALALAMPFAPSLTALVVLRAAQGACLAGLPATAMAYLAEEVHPSALATATGLYIAGNGLGGMSGRIMAGLVAGGFGWRWALGASAAVGVVCTILFWLLVPASRHFRRAPVHPRALIRTVAGHLRNPLLLRLYLLGLLFMGVFGAVYNVTGYRLTAAPFDLPQGVVGLIFVVYLAGTAASARAGRLVARLGRRGALYAAVGTTAAGLLVSVPDTLVTALLGLILITAGFFTGHAIASASVSGTATTGRGQAAALYTAAYYTGNSFGGTLGADVYHQAGWIGAVGVGLVAMAAACGIVVVGTRSARAAAGRRAVLPSR